MRINFILFLVTSIIISVFSQTPTPKKCGQDNIIVQKGGTLNMNITLANVPKSLLKILKEKQAEVSKFKMVSNVSSNKKNNKKNVKSKLRIKVSTKTVKPKPKPAAKKKKNKKNVKSKLKIKVSTKTVKTKPKPAAKKKNSKKNLKSKLKIKVSTKTVKTKPKPAAKKKNNKKKVKKIKKLPKINKKSPKKKPLKKALKKKTTINEQNIVIADGEYKLFSASHRGPQFSGDSVGKKGNHNVWVEQRETYENRGKERWHIRRQRDGTYTLRSKKHGGLLFASTMMKNYGNVKYSKAKTEKKLGSQKGKGGTEFWVIKKLPNGKIKLYSKSQKGALISLDDKDKGGDHYVMVSRNPNSKNNRQQWTLKLMKRK